ncbi:hypothetical protein JWG43_15215 [Desulfobulbus alkaliphilus]|nr:hypothetical protein [Desulfobulbus alkaliphilus]MBM9538425.1 hypothetical protein [Desulfobulbus alkaliphilus]
METLIRHVILAKKPEAVMPINEAMQANLGQISCHLSDTTICHRTDDIPFFPQDYPLLPVRRRFRKTHCACWTPPARTANCAISSGHVT